MPLSSAIAALVLTLIIVTVVASPSAAQFSGVTNECVPKELSTTLSSVNFDAAGRMYFSVDLNSMQEFEYRLIADDRRPLGMMELYDFDEGDADGKNFWCFNKGPTTDTTTCPNQYIANGQSMAIFAPVNFKFGFQKCAGYNASYHSQSMRLQTFYRPVLPMPTVTAEKPFCKNLRREYPTTFCVGSAGAVSAAAVAVAMLAVVTLLL